MQALCGLQGIFDLFNCKTPVPEPENPYPFPDIITLYYHYKKVTSISFLLQVYT